jgi:diguanylate cyclase (GGDEF)-like protein/putative nucleotidyltransferase with HDIG domain
MSAQFPPLRKGAARFIGIFAVIGGSVLVVNLLRWDSPDLLKFCAFFAVAAGASGVKIKLPKMAGTLSASFLFILFGILNFTLQETLLLGASVTLIQCLRQSPRPPRPIRVLFNVTSIAVSIATATEVYKSPWLVALGADDTIRVAVAAFAFFLMNTVPVAIVMTLAEGEGLGGAWRDQFLWAVPYYFAGAALVQLVTLATRVVGWQTALVSVPVFYLISRSYRLYVARLAAEKKHAEEMSALHLRTIEALALAIEAKDHTTHDHLQRVQVYAIEVAKDLGLIGEELEALRAAALLHDIGKLAVPEHIISKPGRLTPEEFEKMKIHPIVGAEILERVKFPYPVAPIVRAHHEKWDGSGYPAGLSGDTIPIGARILSAVDCLDALASDRQYRRALPLDQAMKIVEDQAGTAFDPGVVEVLSRRYVELEQLAIARQADMVDRGKLSTDIKVERGLAPAAGFETAKQTAPARRDSPKDFLSSIAAARQEVQDLFELAQDLGNSLSLDETLSVLAVRLRRMIPHHAIAVYILREGVLSPDYVSGDDFRLFSSLEIPLGQGLSGWVASNRQPIINANPSVECGYLNDPAKHSTLRSALAVPLEGLKGVLGVLTLYHSERDAFSRDHLRILLAISAKLGLSIENALRYRQAESSATTDYLTGLPNARSLFMHLESELSRCRRMNIPLALLVCDLDGFKQVNDLYGHLEGNKVLRDVARGLKDICRDYDCVARMGGDEFVILLPGVRQEGLNAMLERFRSAVESVGGHFRMNTPLRVSIGAAHFPEDGRDAEALLAEADRRMYREKQAPRPVTSWDAPVTVEMVQ